MTEPDPNEIVVIDMSNADRLKLDRQIGDRMEELGHNRLDYDSLNLGFHLAVNWPGDKDCEITLAQLTVLAVKLKMKIVISNLDICKRDDGENG